MSRDEIPLRLYVAGESANSRQAIANLKALCDTHLDGRHTVEIVDVFLNPERAMEDGVFLTPMLLALAFDPPRSVVGTLNDPGVVLQALGLESVA